MNLRPYLACAVILISSSPRLASAEQADLPDLAKLKLAAEAGDSVAQFNYAQRISLSNYKEKPVWIRRSADQGYAPAQHAVAIQYESGLPFTRQNPQAVAREVVRWASRAAFQGYPPAQASLSRYYATGLGVAKDPTVAYMWIQIAFDNPNSGSGERLMAGINRDRLIANMTSEDIREGQRRAGAFIYPLNADLNPIETELLVAQLKLGGVFNHNDRRSAVVNGVRFYMGDTKEVKVDDHGVELTCISIQTKSAQLRVNGTRTEVTLALKR